MQGPLRPVYGCDIQSGGGFPPGLPGRMIGWGGGLGGFGAAACASCPGGTGWVVIETSYLVG
jgi:hypothetical protein